MENLKTLINDEITYLEQVREGLAKKISVAPSGYLKINHSRSGAIRYYQKYFDVNGNHCEEYISKKNNLDKARQLASKKYYQELLETTDKELSALKAFNINYLPDEKYLCYERLSSERKELIEPYIETVEQVVNDWIAQPFEPCNYRPEKLIHETDRGEFVRSKSEVLIANYLYKNSQLYYYKYECPLYLNKTNSFKYPDFTIINKRTGKIKFLEHAGMMDDPDYVESFIKKEVEYVKNGIMPGKDLMISYESQNCPFLLSNFRIEFEDFMNR